MSEEENIISPSDEVRIVNAFKYWYETNTEKGVTSIPDYICKGLLDLYNKEKEKNEELENADLTTVYMNGFYDGEKKWKDKINNKIKELESIEPADDDYNFEMQNDIHSKINILRELLEERN